LPVQVDVQCRDRDPTRGTRLPESPSVQQRNRTTAGEQPLHQGVRQLLSAPQLHGADFPDILSSSFPGNFDPGLSNSSSSAVMRTKEQERKPVPQARCVCQGEYWTLAFEDRLIRLRDSKGLRNSRFCSVNQAENFMSWIWSRELTPGKSMRADPES